MSKNFTFSNPCKRSTGPSLNQGLTNDVGEGLKTCKNNHNTIKMAIYCPQGSGTLHQQLLSMHGIAWYCIVLHDIALYCMILHGIALYCMVLHDIAWYCIVLHGIAWYCMVLHGIEFHCKVLHCIAWY